MGGSTVPDWSNPGKYQHKINKKKHPILGLIN